MPGTVHAWNEWMDDRGIDTYTGVTLQPHYYSRDLDLVWLGAWPNAAAEGVQIGAWI